LQKQLRSIHPVLEFLAIMIFYFSQSWILHRWIILVLFFVIFSV
jgi:hypothetical protein